MTLSGERLVALSDRAFWWESERTAFVADVHLGKDAAFRAWSVPVPSGPQRAALDRLGRLVERTGAQRLVVLGDLWHARAGRTIEAVSEFARWRSAHPALEVWLIEGNHDRRSGPPAEAEGVIVLPENTRLGPFLLAHHPPEDLETASLCGHLHPSVAAVGRGRARERFPCFWRSGARWVVPAFGEFTGSARVNPGPDDEVFACLGQTIARLTISATL